MKIILYNRYKLNHSKQPYYNSFSLSDIKLPQKLRLYGKECNYNIINIGEHLLIPTVVLDNKSYLILSNIIFDKNLGYSDPRNMKKIKQLPS